VSFDIGAIGRAQPLGPATPAANAQPKRTFASALELSQEAVDVNSVEATPPPEVSAAIATASRAYADLEAQGLHIHFAVDRPTGRLAIEVHDLSGNVVSKATPSQVLRAADGYGLGFE
jgi:hypothetical protein